MKIISVETSAQTQMIDITSKIQALVDESGVRDGIVVVYVPHTTSGITINEGADPAVCRDILSVLNTIIPWKFDYHHMEGNSPAHIKTSIMGSSVHIIIESGKLRLGTWQKIFFCEFDGPRNRKVWVKIIEAN